MDSQSLIHLVSLANNALLSVSKFDGNALKLKAIKAEVSDYSRSNLVYVLVQDRTEMGAAENGEYWIALHKKLLSPATVAHTILAFYLAAKEQELIEQCDEQAHAYVAQGGRFA